MKIYLIQADIQGEHILGDYTVLLTAAGYTEALVAFEDKIDKLDKSASWLIKTTRELDASDSFIFPTSISKIITLQ